MAEIHVQPRKNTATPAWVWIIVGLAVVVAILFIVMRRKPQNNAINNTGPNQTSYVLPVAQHMTGGTTYFS
jgi:hypothetical protein